VSYDCVGVYCFILLFDYDGVIWFSICISLVYFSSYIMKCIFHILIVMKENVLFRRIQQSAENASLEFNIPKSFSRLANLSKGDLIRCEILNLKNNKNVLVLEKMQT
jgi:hypothetical protein